MNKVDFESNILAPSSWLSGKNIEEYTNPALIKVCWKTEEYTP